MPALVANGSTIALAAAALIAAVVGIGNLAFAYLNGKWDRRDRLAEAKGDREHALALAREEREHQLGVQQREGDYRMQALREERLIDRRIEVYDDSLARLIRMHEWAADTYPIFSPAGHNDRPTHTGPETGADGRFVIFSTPEVLEAIQEYRRLWWVFAGIAGEIDAYIAQRVHDQEMGARQRIQDVREKLTEQLVKVGALMREELRHPPA